MTDVLDLDAIDGTQRAIVGGKAAHLGDLSRIAGVFVPPGFCVTTAAYRRIAPALDARLAGLAPDDRDAIRALAAELRQGIEETAIPDDLVAAIVGALARSGAEAAYAVRSSATAEDLPTASFAGQHDTYLNIVGPAAILAHVRRCWASLFTERAVTYRLRNGCADSAMAVVVQRMVVAQASGVLMTADPVTGDRRITAIEATFGLGEALVSGRVTPDVFHVHGDAVVAPAKQQAPALTDAQLVRLAQLGRRIEAHAGCPQDIEWCLVDDAFAIVQRRPITTLFPIPAAGDGANHVYVSVGHQQMMTDAMKPLGLSLFQLTALRPMVEAGSRLFVDVTGILASPTHRAGFFAMLEKSEPLIADALRTIVDRGDFIPARPDASPGGAQRPTPPGPLASDPAIVAELIAANDASVAALARDIETRSGAALFDFILADIQELKRLLLDARSHQAIMMGMEARWWLDEHLQHWLGETHATDTLTLSVPHNVTSEMGLALLDVADAIRPHAEVVAFLAQVTDERFLDALPAFAGGLEARDAIAAFLDRYGMRCAGEIDITRPRWRERPSTLVAVLLANIRTFAPGAAEQRFAQGSRAAATRMRELLDRLRALPDGARKAGETGEMIGRVRAFAGYREYPKYGIVRRYALYKQALVREVDRLVQAGVLRDREDSFYLTFAELHAAVRTHEVDAALIRRRMDAFRADQARSPPRVLTSEGEMLAGAYRRDDIPPGALVGLAISAGTIEGRARVHLDMASAAIEAGDILVTTYTDPSWTPVFVAIAGLVTEVGGQMSHGAVIAREYGLPAVVGVAHATQLIRDGQRIRVHGTAGYVELLA